MHSSINQITCECMQRDAINQILRYASKNRLPEGLKEQMLAHLTLKFKTTELQQEQVLEDLPKAIRSSISQQLFRTTLQNTYLFKRVPEDFIVQLVMFSSLAQLIYFQLLLTGKRVCFVIIETTASHPLLFFFNKQATFRLKSIFFQ